MRKSVANLEAQLEAARARSQGLAEQLESCKRELARKEAVLRSTQQFLAKYKKASRPAAAPSDRRAAMEAAKAEAMRTGRCVAVAL